MTKFPTCLLLVLCISNLGHPPACAQQETQETKEAQETKGNEATATDKDQIHHAPDPPKETLQWQTISPQNGGFEVRLPGEPTHVPRTVKPRPDLEISIEMYILSIRGGRVAFFVGYHDIQDLPETDEKRKEILDGGVKGAMVNVVGELTSHEHVEIDGHPARIFTYNGSRRSRELQGHSQMVLVGQRVYQLSIIQLAAAELDPDIREQFFSSFKLLGTEE